MSLCVASLMSFGTSFMWKDARFRVGILMKKRIVQLYTILLPGGRNTVDYNLLNVSGYCGLQNLKVKMGLKRANIIGSIGLTRYINGHLL